MARLPAATHQPVWYGRDRTGSPVLTHIAYHKILHRGRIPPHTMKWNELGLLERGELHLSLDGQAVTVKARHFVLLAQGMAVSSDDSAGTIYWVGLQPASPQALACHPELGAELLDTERLIQVNTARSIPGTVELLQAVQQAFLRVHGKTQDPFLRQASALEVVGHLRLALKTPSAADRLGEDWVLIRAALEYIAAHPEAQPSLGELARICRVGRTTFAESFKRTLGMPPHEYLNRWKVQRAADLLEDGCAVAEVSRRLGFSSPRYFTRVYRRMLGRDPGTPTR